MSKPDFTPIDPAKIGSGKVAEGSIDISTPEALTRLQAFTQNCKTPLASLSTDGSQHITSPSGKVIVDTSKHGDVTITTLGPDGKSVGHLTATYQNGVSGSDRSFKPDPELANQIRIAASAAKACGKFDMAEEVVRSEVGQKTKSVEQGR